MKAASESCLVACWRVIATVVLDLSHFCDLFCFLLLSGKNRVSQWKQRPSHVSWRADVSSRLLSLMYRTFLIYFVIYLMFHHVSGEHTVSRWKQRLSRVSLRADVASRLLWSICCTFVMYFIFCYVSGESTVSRWQQRPSRVSLRADVASRLLSWFVALLWTFYFVLLSGNDSGAAFIVTRALLSPILLHRFDSGCFHRDSVTMKASRVSQSGAAFTRVKTMKAEWPESKRWKQNESSARVIPLNNSQVRFHLCVWERVCVCVYVCLCVRVCVCVSRWKQRPSHVSWCAAASQLLWLICCCTFVMFIFLLREVWKILCCNWFVALLWFILFFIVWWENTVSRWKQRLSHVSLRADVALQLL